MRHREYAETAAEMGRIQYELKKACEEAGLPWNDLFASLGQENSRMRDVAIEAWAERFVTRDLAARFGRCTFERVSPTITTTFVAMYNWGQKRKVRTLTLEEMGAVPGVLKEVKGFRVPWKLVELELSGEASRQFRALNSRGIQSVPYGQYFAAYDWFIVFNPPPHSLLRLESFRSYGVIALRLNRSQSIKSVKIELDSYGCSLLSVKEVLNIDPSPKGHVLATSHKDERYTFLQDGERIGGADSTDVDLDESYSVYGRFEPLR